MTDYLDRIGAGKILISKEPFSFDWTPPSLVGREKELMEIASIFIGIDNPNVSARVTIMGPVGSGKTVLAKRFSDDLIKKLEGRRKIVSIHINCRNY